MANPDISLDDLNGGFLGVEHLILDVDYAMTLNVEYDGQPGDPQVSLILGPERCESQILDAYLAEHRDELSIRRLECPQCGCLGTSTREPICKNCRSPLEAVRDTSQEWLRKQAWKRLQWEVPGFQARSVVPKWLVGELYPGNSATPPDMVLPLSLVFERLLESMRDTKSGYIRECWNHLHLGKSIRDMLPRGETVQDKHRHYLITREKLIAGYNWLMGLAHKYPEFLEEYEHTGIRRFPPAVTLKPAIPAADNDVTPPDEHDAASDTSTPKKPKRSTERGEGRTKLIAALTKHHQYADGGCLNLEPIGNNELARQAEVDRATASAFFRKQFKGHGKYKAACTDSGRLVTALKLLNGEFAPHLLYGAKPPNEDDRAEEE